METQNWWNSKQNNNASFVKISKFHANLDLAHFQLEKDKEEEEEKLLSSNFFFFFPV